MASSAKWRKTGEITNSDFANEIGIGTQGALNNIGALALKNMRQEVITMSEYMKSLNQDTSMVPTTTETQTSGIQDSGTGMDQMHLVNTH